MFPRHSRFGSRLFSAALACVALIGINWQPASGAVVGRPLTDDELVERAGLVVVGQVLRVTSEWNAARTQIFSYVDLRVDQALKGALSQRTLRLRVLGGTVGDVGMFVPETPQFAPNEELVLFLERNPQTLFPVVGLEQGKLSVRTVPATGQKLVTERGASLDEYARRVRGIAEAQAFAAQQSNLTPPSVLQPKEAR